jgi:hypothetical protein
VSVFGEGGEGAMACLIAILKASVESEGQEDL